MSDYESPAPWSSENIMGCKRFLDRVERMESLVDNFDGVHSEHVSALNTIINKVTSDIDNMKFNTALSSLMTFVNNIYADKYISRQEFREMLILLYPFAPHFAEEMNERLGFKEMLCKSTWPKTRVDNSKKFINLPVQVNGKMKEVIRVEEGIAQDMALELIKSNEKLSQYIGGGIKKVIFVPNKIINLIA